MPRMSSTETSTPGFLTLRVNQELIDWYEQQAQAKGVRRSDEIRAALEQYREKQG